MTNGHLTHLKRQLVKAVRKLKKKKDFRPELLMKKQGVNCRHFVSRTAANKHATVLSKRHGFNNVVVNAKLVKREWNYTVCTVPRSQRIKMPRTKRS